MTKNSGLKSGKKCNIREAAALFASKAKIKRSGPKGASRVRKNFKQRDVYFSL